MKHWATLEQRSEWGCKSNNRTFNIDGTKGGNDFGGVRANMAKVARYFRDKAARCS